MFSFLFMVIGQVVCVVLLFSDSMVMCVVYVFRCIQVVVWLSWFVVSGLGIECSVVISVLGKFQIVVSLVEILVQLKFQVCFFCLVWLLLSMLYCLFSGVIVVVVIVCSCNWLMLCIMLMVKIVLLLFLLWMLVCIDSQCVVMVVQRVCCQNCGSFMLCVFLKVVIMLLFSIRLCIMMKFSMCSVLLIVLMVCEV